METTANTLDTLADDLIAGRVIVIDLTQPLHPGTPVIELPGEFAPSPGVTIDVISKYDDRGPAWYWSTIRMGEHTGTHFDAPVHWLTGKDLPESACDTLPVRQFIAPACVIDASDEAAADEDFLLQPAHVEGWESIHGRIPAGCWVLLRTGWSKRNDPSEFRNSRDDGPHTPGPSPATVELLAHDRDVLGFGTETIGTDAGQAGGFDPPFPCHAIMHGAGKLGLASLCNLDKLPPIGSIVIAAPLKLVAGSGSPIRALAIVPG